MISIRRASSDDYAAYAGLFRELLIDDPVPDHATWLEHFMPFTWVATLAGEVVAYCYVQAFEKRYDGLFDAPTSRRIAQLEEL